MSVQRSIGSKVAAWITRVPPAIGSRRHHHSLSKPEPVTRSRKTDSGRASRLSTRAGSRSSPRRVHADASPRRRATTGRRARAAAPGIARPTRRDRGAPPRRPAAGPGRRRVARPPARRAGGRRRGDTRPRGPDGRPSSSDADRVPDRLHLEEGGDPFGAFGGAVVEPVEPRVRRSPRGRRDRRLMSSAASCSTSTRRSSGTPQTSSASTIVVTGEHRHELLLPAGQHVDDPTRDVGRGQDLGQGDGRQRPALGCEQHDGVTRDERRSETAARARAATRSRARRCRRCRSARGS